MASAVAVWEALPEVNKHARNGHFVIKRSDGYVKPSSVGRIYLCCGRAFLTKESYDNHAKRNCLQLEKNSKKRPKEYNQFSHSKCFSNLLMLKPECEKDKLTQKLLRRYNLPVAVILLKKIQISQILHAKRLEDRMPRLSPVTNNIRSVYSLKDNDDFHGPPIIEPVSISPVEISASFEAAAKKVVRNPLHCFYCDFSTESLSSLTKHYTIQHAETDEADAHYEKILLNKTRLGKRTSISIDDSNTPCSVLKCNLCHLKLPSEEKLTEHNNHFHVPNSQFRCIFCPCGFKDDNSLQIHLASFHKAKQIAPIVLRPETLDSDPKKRFKCPDCIWTYRSLGEVTKHKTLSHVIGGTPCSDCSCSFETPEGLKRHIWHRHTPGKLKVTSIRVKPTEESIDDSNTSCSLFKCDLCHLIFSSKKKLKKHNKLSHVIGGTPCSNCSCSFATPEELKVHNWNRHRRKKLKVAASRVKPTKESVEDSNTACSLFKCDLCHLILTSAKKLKKHNEFSHVVGGTPCGDCSYSFATPLGLKIHIGRTHTPGKSKVTSIRVNPTEKSIGDSNTPCKLFKCDLCHLIFAEKYKLKHHNKLSHVIGGKPCSDCSCSFATPEGLKKHIWHRHTRRKLKVTSNKVKRTKQSSAPTKPANEEKVRPLIENRTNEICYEDLRKEQPVIKGRPCPCPILEKETMENSLRDSISCKFCNEKFPTIQDRNSHHNAKHANLVEVRRNIIKALKAEESGKGVRCELCPLKITSLPNLDSHLKVAHNPDFQYLCPKCPCRFETERGLVVHTSIRHSSKTKTNTEKTEDGSPNKLVDLTCNLCSKRQKDKNHLIFHMQTAHVPDGKFKCESCCCCYNTEVGLRNHNNYAHRKIFDEDKQKFICHYCGAAKSTMEKLKRHKKREHVKKGKFFCTMCSCRFLKHKVLQRHLNRVHKMTSYKISKCTVCSVEVFSAKELKIHMKAAHVENGLACSRCPCKFANRLSLDSHEKYDHLKNEIVANVKESGRKTINGKDGIDDSANMGETNAEATKVNKINKFSCNICSSTFLTKTLLTKHMITCHGDSHTFTCKECPCAFDNQHGVMVHYARKHRKSEKTKSPKRKRTASPTSTQISNGEVNISLKCKICPEIFSTEMELKQHASSHDSASTKVIPSLDRELVVENFRMDDTLDDASDSTAGNSGTNSSDVTIGDNDIVSRASSVDDMNSTHEEPAKRLDESTSPGDNFPACRCKKCHIIFTSVDCLLEHLKKKHKMTTKFKCTLCRATFVNPLLFTKHLKIHAPENQSGDDVPETNSSEASPSKKLRSSSKNTVETKQYQCQNCEHHFDNVTLLAEHITSKHDVSHLTDCTKCGLPFITGDLIGMLEHQQACLSSDS